MRNKEYIDYIMDLLSLYGNITHKRMFGGTGIYVDKTIFAIIKDNELYFKVNHELAQEYKKAGAYPLTYKRDNKLVTLSYWQVPADILEDEDTLKHWFNKSLSVAVNKKQKINAKTNKSSFLNDSKYTYNGLSIILRIEGFCLLLGALALYEYFSSDWKQFSYLVFLPEISYLGYLIGRKTGAITYNILHSYLFPIILLIIAFNMNQQQVFPYLLIWIVNISFNRSLGFGLRYFNSLSYTHLGRIKRLKNKYDRRKKYY